MNDMSVLLDLMRGWLALLSIVATMFWLLYPREIKAEDEAEAPAVGFVDEPDAGRQGVAAARSASMVSRTGVSDASTPEPRVAIAWYPEHLDLHTGQPFHAGVGSGEGR